jgi:hypothetical protein
MLSGELGHGGCSKASATPSRLPWAQRASSLAASCGGRFAAMTDAQGRLFTFGAGGLASCGVRPSASLPHVLIVNGLLRRCAGKFGSLGHGDTAKRAVGRQVKALLGRTVHAAACGADWMLVVTGWRSPACTAPAHGGRTSSRGAVQAVGQLQRAPDVGHMVRAAGWLLWQPTR